MPNLADLFRDKIITDGPNIGKTAEEAYAPKNSKSNDINTSNIFINKVAGLNGGVLKLFDVLGKVNKARKDRSVVLGETLTEQNETGLFQLATIGKPYLYGGDFFRISNGRTRSLILMNSSVGRGVAGGIDDKIGIAVGNYAGDAMANLLNNGKKAQLPPKPDFAALGTELAVDVADRALGAVLPQPMIPTKVASEFESWYSSASQMASATNVNLSLELNTNKKVIELVNKSKAKGFAANLLKSNKNALAQTKDFLISAASGIVNGLVKAGVSSLVRASVTALTKQKMANILLGPGQTKKPSGGTELWDTFIDDTSKRPYSELLSNIKNYSKDYTNWGDLATFLYNRNSQFIQNLANAGLMPQQVALDAIKNMNNEPTNYSVAHELQKKDTLFTQRGMSSKQDELNINPNITYIGTEALDPLNNNQSYDDKDFIALKFFSIFLEETVQFRCTVSQLTETFTPNWESSKFIGNPFNFYTYNGIERTLNFSFKVFSLNALEHRNAWQRLNFLAGLTYPQSYNGLTGAVAPPIIKFTLGDMYKKRDAIIDSLTFNVDENTTWDTGNSAKLNGDIYPTVGGGFSYVIDANVTTETFKLPKVINVEVSLKFVESRGTTGPSAKSLYGYI
jgi:hypothetical protein